MLSDYDKGINNYKTNKNEIILIPEVTIKNGEYNLYYSEVPPDISDREKLKSVHEGIKKAIEEGVENGNKIIIQQSEILPYEMKERIGYYTTEGLDEEGEENYIVNLEEYSINSETIYIDDSDNNTNTNKILIIYGNYKIEIVNNSNTYNVKYFEEIKDNNNNEYQETYSLNNIESGYFGSHGPIRFILGTVIVWITGIDLLKYFYDYSYKITENLTGVDSIIELNKNDIVGVNSGNLPMILATLTFSTINILACVIIHNYLVGADPTNVYKIAFNNIASSLGVSGNYYAESTTISYISSYTDPTLWSSPDGAIYLMNNIIRTQIDKDTLDTLIPLLIPFSKLEDYGKLWKSFTDIPNIGYVSEQSTTLDVILTYHRLIDRTQNTNAEPNRFYKHLNSDTPFNLFEYLIRYGIDSMYSNGKEGNELFTISLDPNKYNISQEHFNLGDLGDLVYVWDIYIQQG